MDEASRTEDAVDYERKDLDPRSIALFGAGLALVLVLTAGLITLLYQYAAKRYLLRQPPAPPIGVTREATAPQLQVNGPADLRAMRAAEDRALNSYGWVDRNAGTVRIPIDRAIEILAEKGLPAREEGNRQQATGNRKSGAKR